MSEILGQSGHALSNLQQPFGARSGSRCLREVTEIVAIAGKLGFWFCGEVCPFQQRGNCEAGE